MIHSWRIARFKSIGAPIELQLAPLTLLCGANSSGKSTVIHSMLLVSQSVASRYFGNVLQLNGPRVQLGTFEDIAHRRTAPSVAVGMSFDARVDDLRAEPATTAARRARRARPEARSVVGQLDFVVAPEGKRSGTALRLSQLAYILNREDEPTYELSARRRHSRPPLKSLASGTAGITLLGTDHYLLKSSGEVSESSTRWPLRSETSTSKRQPAGVEVQGIVPIAAWFDYDPIARQAADALQNLLIGAPFSYFRAQSRQGTETQQLVRAFFRQSAVRKLFSGQILDPYEETEREATTSVLDVMAVDQRQQLYEAVESYIGRLERRRDHPTQFERLRPPTWVSSANQSLIRDLVGIRHVGPLREPPRALFELSTAADIQDVGPRGQFTAAVLYRFGSSRVAYWWDGQSKEETLQVAVDFWMRHLGVHSGAKTSERGKLGHQLGIRDDALPVDLDLTQVGVGVSQLLPIVVQALLTPIGGVLILEQPELHLNPAIQAGLTDFLVSIVRAGRQVICETHSEYLVNRLRIQLGEKQISYPQDVRVYFAQRRAGASSFAEVEFDDRGRIRNWPDGFFDQSAIDSARLLQLDLSD